MDFLAFFLDIAILPLQVILIPIDALLARIDGIGAIPSYINQLFSLIGSIPATLLALTGLSPVLWNLAIATFVVFLTFSPAINAIKKIWAFIRF